ncbi:MAG: hypothetical protein ACI4CY_06560 [Candidatus Gastranaerophilaceae bacterium]
MLGIQSLRFPVLYPAKHNKSIFRQNKMFTSYKAEDGTFYVRRTGDTFRKAEVAENSAKKLAKRMKRINSRRPEVEVKSEAEVNKLSFRNKVLSRLNSKKKQWSVDKEYLSGFKPEIVERIKRKGIDPETMRQKDFNILYIDEHLKFQNEMRAYYKAKDEATKNS